MAARHVEIAEDLLAGIENGRYPPGGHLPTEDALMVHYATSRNTVRRALERLANLGRIDTRQGSGSQVREYKPITHLASSIKGAADDERWSEYAARLREKQEGVPHQTLKVGFEAATGMIARLLDLNPSETEGFVVIRRCDRVVDGKLWERQISYYPEDIAVGTELMRPEDIKRGTITVLAELGYEQTGRGTSWRADALAQGLRPLRPRPRRAAARARARRLRRHPAHPLHQDVHPGRPPPTALRRRGDLARSAEVGLRREHLRPLIPGRFESNAVREKGREPGPNPNSIFRGSAARRSGADRWDIPQVRQQCGMRSVMLSHKGV